MTTGTTDTKPSQPNSRQLRLSREALLCAALEAFGKQEGDRGKLVSGGEHDVAVKILGRVDGIETGLVFDAMIYVGHDSRGASSSSVKREELVAFLLSKLSPVVRDKLLDELPGIYAKDKKLPSVEPALIKEANRLCKRLNQRKTVPKEGNVRVEIDRLFD